MYLEMHEEIHACKFTYKEIIAHMYNTLLTSDLFLQPSPQCLGRLAGRGGLLSGALPHRAGQVSTAGPHRDEDTGQDASECWEVSLEEQYK